MPGDVLFDALGRLGSRKSPHLIQPGEQKGHHAEVELRNIPGPKEIGHAGRFDGAFGHRFNEMRRRNGRIGIAGLGDDVHHHIAFGALFHIQRESVQRQSDLVIQGRGVDDVHHHGILGRRGGACRDKRGEGHKQPQAGSHLRLRKLRIDGGMRLTAPFPRGI